VLGDNCGIIGDPDEVPMGIVRISFWDRRLIRKSGAAGTAEIASFHRWPPASAVSHKSAALAKC